MAGGAPKDGGGGGGGVDVGVVVAVGVGVEGGALPHGTEAATRLTLRMCQGGRGKEGGGHARLRQARPGTIEQRRQSARPEANTKEGARGGDRVQSTAQGQARPGRLLSEIASSSSWMEQAGGVWGGERTSVYVVL